MSESDAKGILARSRNTAGPVELASVGAGVLAAATLERACRDHATAPGEERLELYLESVGELARGLGAELAALMENLTEKAGGGEPETAFSALVSAALRAADLATLAACAAPELPEGGPARLRAVEAAHLAAAAARSAALERRALGAPGDLEDRDLRGAEWRAGLAARQVEEARQEA